MQRTKVAILGAGFITDIHMESYHRFIPEAEVVAVYAEMPTRRKPLPKAYPAMV
jgi:predicted dehydrogenase